MKSDFDTMYLKTNDLGLVENLEGKCLLEISNSFEKFKRVSKSHLLQSQDSLIEI